MNETEENVSFNEEEDQNGICADECFRLYLSEVKASTICSSLEKVTFFLEIVTDTSNDSYHLLVTSWGKNCATVLEPIFSVLKVQPFEKFLDAGIQEIITRIQVHISLI